MPREKLLGPILFLRQGILETWRFSVGLWVEASGAGALKLSFTPADGVSSPVSPRPGGNVLGGEWLMWDVEVQRTDKERRFAYQITGLTESCQFDNLVIPARGQAPRVAFFSCNGIEDPRKWTGQPAMERLWPLMLRRHSQPADPDGSGGAYHVLVGGGDQIYCDGVWRTDHLKDLASWKERKAVKVTPTIRKEIEDVYAEMYSRWRDSYFRDLHARIPAVYTWDDHDIFDGWGSYDDGLQRCDLFKAIFSTARRAFTAFQLGSSDLGGETLCLEPGAGHFLQAVRFEDKLDMLLLDLRSQRTFNRVMDEDQWKALHAYLASRVKDGATPSHLLVVSSIPIVYLNFSTAEKFLDWFPWRQTLEDDLHDQWESGPHQQERGRLIMTLLDHAAQTRTRISVLSGDVHVGARGKIVSRRPAHLFSQETESTIHQLTSSGIVFPPPSALALAGMRAISKEGPTPVIQVSQVETEVVPVSARHFLLGCNNWLSLEPDQNWQGSAKRLWVRWMTEQGEVEPPLVIHRRG